MIYFWKFINVDDYNKSFRIFPNYKLSRDNEPLKQYWNQYVILFLSAPQIANSPCTDALKYLQYNHNPNENNRLFDWKNWNTGSCIVLFVKWVV